MDVDEVIARPFGDFGERGLVGPVGPVRVLQPDDRGQPVGMAISEVVDRQHAEVEAGEDRPLFAQVVEQPDEVADGVIAVVPAIIRGRAGAPHPAHVGRDHVPAPSGQCADLAMPAEPSVRKPMTQHEQRPFALLDIVHLQTVDRRVVMRPAAQKKQLPPLATSTEPVT